MSGVEKLRARVAELSTAIHLQKEVLKNLEKDKSLVQAELNAALDPVARLPPEISSEIFLQSLPCFLERKPSVQDAPLLFLHICHAWRDIALFTPDLWSEIQVRFPCAPGFNEGVQAWLHRASNRLLSISLCGPGAFKRGATAIIWQHAKRLKHLELCYKESDDEDDEEIDLLGGTLGPMPSLETLAIRGSAPLNGGQVYSGPQIRELLRLATNLVECTFECVSVISGIRISAELLVIPSLRRISFGNGSDDNILASLSLPGLEVISVSLWRSSAHDLPSFLKQSLPPLRELVITDCGLASAQLHECLRLLPLLENFQLRGPGPTFLDEFFAALAESSFLLPRLHSLTIHFWPPIFFDSAFCYVAFFRALLSRRTQIRHVHLELLHGALPPTADQISAFRDLTMEGIQIYIGGEGGKHNLVPA